MGKERNTLIRRYGGVPVEEEHLSDAELVRRYMESYACQGRLPPEIEAIRRKAFQNSRSDWRPGGRSLPSPDRTDHSKSRR
jgi:hypothetical protein